jgi:hypothetical protein
MHFWVNFLRLWSPLGTKAAWALLAHNMLLEIVENVFMTKEPKEIYL